MMTSWLVRGRHRKRRIFSIEMHTRLPVGSVITATLCGNPLIFAGNVTVGRIKVQCAQTRGAVNEGGEGEAVGAVN